MAQVTEIYLKAEYMRWPTWLATDTGYEDLDVETFPISPDLLADLKAWAVRF
jgi:hypothetical protein